MVAMLWKRDDICQMQTEQIMLQPKCFRETEDAPVSFQNLLNSFLLSWYEDIVVSVIVVVVIDYNDKVYWNTLRGIARGP